MDVHLNKRAVSSGAFERRGLSLPSRDSNQTNKSIQSCNRLGCSTRYNSIKGTDTDNMEKPKASNTAFRSSNKAAVNCSSRSTTSSITTRKSREPRNQGSDTITEEGGRKNKNKGKFESHSRRQDMIQLIPGSTENQIDLDSQIDEFSTNSSEASGSSSTSEKSRYRKQVVRQSGSVTQNAVSSSTVARRNVISKSGAQPVRLSQGQNPDTRRNGFRNLSCPSRSDVLSSACFSSPSDSLRDRNNDASQRSSSGGSSDYRVKNHSGSLVGRTSGYQRTTLAANSRNLENSLSLPPSRRSRIQSGNGNDTFSIRTPTSRNENNMMRFTMDVEDIDEGQQIIDDGRFMLDEVPHVQSHNGETALTRSSTSSQLNATTRRTRSSSSSTQNRQVSHIEENSSQMLHGHLADTDIYRRINMEGIAEVLLALERIEQDEELTYEQLLVLENNFLSGFGFYDQHRDMRLDIDSMSYEELLDLGDRMGTVSTALTEEALSKCLKKSIYVPAPVNLRPNAYDDEDFKCSICQEEYAAGDEVGTLRCHHLYHAACIHMWLGQKNWCPVCKSSASPF